MDIFRNLARKIGVCPFFACIGPREDFPADGVLTNFKAGLHAAGIGVFKAFASQSLGRFGGTRELIGQVSSLQVLLSGVNAARAGAKSDAVSIAFGSAAQGQRIAVFDEAAGLAGVEGEGLFAAPAELQQ